MGAMEDAVSTTCQAGRETKARLRIFDCDVHPVPRDGLNTLAPYIPRAWKERFDRKQALHDMAAGTLVVDRWAWTGHPERQQRHVGALAVLLGVLLLLVPMLGIIAAIAVSQYQDYVYRAKVATAIAVARPLQPLVGEMHRGNGACPVNGDGGLRDAGDYATAGLASIEAGAMQGSGACALQLTLRIPGSAGLDGKRLWLELDPGSGRWTCSSEIADKYLPRDCRSR